MHIVHAVELEVGRGEKVPGILQIPRTTSPVPGVLLLHGFSSQKERLADSVGRGLIRGGVASLREQGISFLTLQRVKRCGRCECLVENLHAFNAGYYN